MASHSRFETLVDIYQESIQSFPNNELFGVKRDGRWEWMTYREFGKNVDRFRGGLSGRGIRAGDVVAMISNNCPEWATAAYASFGLGAAFVPMYEAQTAKDWEFIIRDCGAKALIVAGPAILEKTRGFLESIPTLQQIIVLGGASTYSDEKIVSFSSLLGAEAVPPHKPNRDDVACLLYTSGTTGNPKGVILSHFNFASNVSAVHQVFPLDRLDRSLSFLPWAHAFGQTVELHCLFSMGGSIAIAESVDKLFSNFSEVNPTLLFSVPRVFNKLYARVQKIVSEKPKPIQHMVQLAMKAAAKERDGIRLSVPEHLLLSATDKLVFSKVRAGFGGRLKYAFSGGAAISREVAEFIDGLGVTVYEGYGLTETSPIATVNCMGQRKIGSVGRPIPGVRVEIDSSMIDSKRATPGREEGEIVIYGPNIMKGYHNRPEENAAVFTKDGGFRTGDMGYIDPFGFLYITGRIKEQYKLENGKYVVPTPLEEAIKLSPFVANVMVYGDNRPYNVALVVAEMDTLRKWAAHQALGSANGDDLLNSPQVRELYKHEIANFSKEFKGFEGVREFALISQDFTTDNGMLTPSLKLKRRKVLEVYGAAIEGLYKKK